MKNIDHSLATLIELDGLEQRFINGYWVKFSAKEIEPEIHHPHGIKYSLTLHHPGGTRLLGYDNAHLADIKRKKYSAKRIEWDHMHQRSIVSDYDFDNAGQLLEDFWNQVDRILTEEGV